jgi:glycosyltransferase involved in cell wall biosynthesis
VCLSRPKRRRTATSQHDRSTSLLRGTEVGGIKHSRVYDIAKATREVFEPTILLGTQELGDVLHHEDLRLYRVDRPPEFPPKLISLVIRASSAESTEALTRRTAHNDVCLRESPDRLDVPDKNVVPKIVAICCSRSRVVFDCENGLYGSLGATALARRYAAASIFALASTREAYGIVYAEALAHGLPIVGCDIPAVREVTGGAAILVAPGRVASLAAALKMLLSDERKRRAQARRSRLRARQLPTWTESETRFVRAVSRDADNWRETVELT